MTKQDLIRQNFMKECSMAEALKYAAEQFEEARIRSASVEVTETAAYLNVRRAFGVEGTLIVNFELDAHSPDEDGRFKFLPRVRLNTHAFNRAGPEVAAFHALINELAPLAATVQVELDEFNIVAKSDRKKGNK